MTAWMNERLPAAEKASLARDEEVSWKAIMTAAEELEQASEVSAVVLFMVLPMGFVLHHMYPCVCVCVCVCVCGP